MVATVGLLAIMLNLVCFEVFGIVEGEIALNTRIRFVFSLQFHGRFLNQLVLLNQSVNTVVGRLRSRYYSRSGAIFEK